ncbi:tetratricopeptide repeat protein [bacterium]|nr:tetratricopeptide repeat protein [bacterium]
MRINPGRKKRQKSFLVRDILEIEKEAFERGLIPSFDINLLLDIFYQVKKKAKEYLKYRVCPVAQLKAIHKAMDELFEVSGEEPSLLMSEGLAKRKLDCDLTCGVYLSIARELNLPFYGALVPSHAILTWRVGQSFLYFDTISGDITNASSLKSFRKSILFPPLYDKEFMSTFYNTLGVRFAEVGKHQDAIFFFNKALKCYSLDVRLFYHKAVSLAQLGHYKQAVSWCEKAINLDSFDWKAHFNMGVCLAMSGKYEEAINSYNRAEKLHPKDYRIYYYRADALMHSGHLALAIKDYKKALFIHSGDDGLRKDYETALRYSQEP